MSWLYIAVFRFMKKSAVVVDLGTVCDVKDIYICHILPTEIVSDTFWIPTIVGR